MAKNKKNIDNAGWIELPEKKPDLPNLENPNLNLKEDIPETGWMSPETMFSSGFEVIDPILINKLDDGRVIIKGKLLFERNYTGALILNDSIFKEKIIFYERPIEHINSKLLILNDGNLHIVIGSQASLEVVLDNIILF